MQALTAVLSYTDITKYFRSYLFDEAFQSFLSQVFSDLTEYDITQSDYIISEDMGIELGFTNNEAVYDDDDKVIFEYGRPIFSHFNIYPRSIKLIDRLPFDISFRDSRTSILAMAGPPTKTNKGYAPLLEKNFLNDRYKVGQTTITFDYNITDESINFIQIEDNTFFSFINE